MEKHQSNHLERGKRHFIRLLFIFTIGSCSLLAPSFFPSELASAVPSNLLLSSSQVAAERKRILLSTDNGSLSPLKETPLSCAFVKKNSICCDRSSLLSDVCVLRGNISTNPSSSSIFLYLGADSRNISDSGELSKDYPVEKIRPYARKWDTKLMKTVEELNLAVLKASNDSEQHCDVSHRVPAIVFSAGVFNGDVSEEFNDGLIPLYITSRRFNRRVVFMVLNYQPSWRAKYRQVLSRLSAYPPIDFSGENRTHCFPVVTVGLRSHGEFAINPSLTSPTNLTILDFRRLLNDAYGPRMRYLESMKNQTAEKETLAAPLAPKLLILFENGSKAVGNEKELVELCEEMGFKVQELRLDKNMEIAKIYAALNSTDAVLGVAGCALTHLLFMRPAGIFIQVLPLGMEGVVEAKFSGLAKEIGLEYISYRIKTSDSLISMVNEEQKTVRLDLNSLLSSLTRAFQQIVASKIEEDNSSLKWNENWLPRRSAA